MGTLLFPVVPLTHSAWHRAATQLTLANWMKDQPLVQGNLHPGIGNQASIRDGQTITFLHAFLLRDSSPYNGSSISYSMNLPSDNSLTLPPVGKEPYHKTCQRLPANALHSWYDVWSQGHPACLSQKASPTMAHLTRDTWRPSSLIPSPASGIDVPQALVTWWKDPSGLPASKHPLYRTNS